MEVKVSGLEKLMLKRGLNIADIAKICDLSVYPIRRILSGGTVNIKTASALANAFQDEGVLAVEVNGIQAT